MQLNILRLDSGQGRHGLAAKPAPVLAQDPLRRASPQQPLSVCRLYSLWQRQEVREREGEQACGSVAESCGLAPGLGGSTLPAPVLLQLRLLHGWLGLALFPLPYLQTPVICTPICGQMASRLAPGHPAWRGGVVFSNLCLAIWAGARGGGSPHGGGQAQHHPWGFKPKTSLHDIPLILFRAQESYPILYPHH